MYGLTKNEGILEYLKQLKVTRPEVAHLIEGGVELV